MPVIPQPPTDVRDCRLVKRLQELSNPEDGLAEKVDQLIRNVEPQLDRIADGPFRNYTLHNPGHSRKVIHLMGYVISQGTLDSLTPLDLTVLVMSAYLHDLGMCLTSAERSRALADPAFEDALNSEPNLLEQPTIARAQRDRDAIPPHVDSDGPAKDPETTAMPMEATIFHLQELAIAAYLRPRHATHQRYSELVERIRNHTGRDDLFRLRDVSFLEHLIEVCVSHNCDITTLADARGPYDERFPRDAVIGGLILNVQFCAACLRLADVLDFDRERTPKVLFENLGIATNQLPGAEVSLLEWQKHMAVHSLEIREDEVVIHADSPHPAIEAAIRSFCTQIEREIRDTTAVL